jgi:hypothetical protein
MHTVKSLIFGFAFGFLGSAGDQIAALRASVS